MESRWSDLLDMEGEMYLAPTGMVPVCLFLVLRTNKLNHVTLLTQVYIDTWMKFDYRQNEGKLGNPGHDRWTG